MQHKRIKTSEPCKVTKISHTSVPIPGCVPLNTSSGGGPPYFLCPVVTSRVYPVRSNKAWNAHQHKNVTWAADLLEIINHLWQQCYPVYLNFCLVWALVRVLYFTALLFSLSIRLHDSTKESTFILHWKEIIKTVLLIATSTETLRKENRGCSLLMRLPVHGTGRSP